MNHEDVSGIRFEECCTIPAEQTACALFARLPNGCGDAERIVERLATGYLVAAIESICTGLLQRHVHADDEIVVSQRIHIEHRRPMPSGGRITLCRWVGGLGERSASFRVHAHHAQELVCEAIVTLATKPRRTFRPWPCVLSDQDRTHGGL